MARSTTRITQNAVLSLTVAIGSYAIGTVVIPYEGAAVSVDGKQKNTIDLKTLDGTLVETVQPGDTSKVAKYLNVASTDDAVNFLNGHNSLTVVPTGGYSSFYNSHGAVNPQTPRTLDTQGLVKNILIFTQALHEIAMRGGPEGDEATAALKTLQDYNQVAAENLAEAQKNNLENDLLSKAKSLGINPEDLKSLLAKKATAEDVVFGESAVGLPA
jgi:hypothetical protein